MPDTVFNIYTCKRLFKGFWIFMPDTWAIMCGDREELVIECDEANALRIVAAMNDAYTKGRLFYSL